MSGRGPGALAAAAVLSVLSCSSGGSGPSTPTTPPSSGVSTSTSILVYPEYPEIQPEALPPEGTPQGWRVRLLPPVGVALLAPRSLRLSFGGLALPKFKLLKAEISESADAVTIDLVGAGPGEGPAGPAAMYQHTFALAADLGDRPVLVNGRAVAVAVVR